MEELGLGLILGGAVIAGFLGGVGYLWAHANHVFGGEPPQWLAMSSEQQAVERHKALANIHALGSHWRRWLIVGAAVSVLGVVLLAAG